MDISPYNSSTASAAWCLTLGDNCLIKLRSAIMRSFKDKCAACRCAGPWPASASSPRFRWSLPCAVSFPSPWSGFRL